jgi:hypothetical protein
MLGKISRNSGSDLNNPAGLEVTNQAMEEMRLHLPISKAIAPCGNLVKARQIVTFGAELNQGFQEGPLST